MEKWKQYEIYKEVAGVGHLQLQPMLTAIRVCIQKIVDRKLVPKARYVIQGF